MAPINKDAEAFGHIATQAPQPMQAAASMERSAVWGFLFHAFKNLREQAGPICTPRAQPLLPLQKGVAHPMPYTSPELTHFVGRQHKDDKQKQFDLLIKVVECGILSPRWDNPHSWYNRGYGGTVSLINGEMYPQFCNACFCDIPLDNLRIHMEKYSEFGLAFPKSFMIAKGATPVFYVAQDAPYIFSTERLADRFVEMANRFQALFDRVKVTPRPPDIASELHELENAWSFMMQQVLAYIKVFDGSKTDSDIDNYYMEREWRVVGGIEFSLEDIARVIVPRQFAQEFTYRLPTYRGEISFSDC